MPHLENCRRAPNVRFKQGTIVEYPKSLAWVNRPPPLILLPQQPPLPQIGTQLIELKYEHVVEARVWKKT